VDLKQLRENGIIKLEIGSDNFFLLHGENYITDFKGRTDLMIVALTNFTLEIDAGTLYITRACCPGNPKIVVQFNSPNKELNDIIVWEVKESNILTPTNTEDFNALSQDVRFQDKEFYKEAEFKIVESLSTGGNNRVYEKLFCREVEKDLFEYILIKINHTRGRLEVWTGVVIDKNEIKII
jgi:hypothetical protein